MEPLLAGISATDLDYSADGKWVGYVTIPEGTLWRSRVDGTERLQLTNSPERAVLPRWSPDGKRIAYVTVQPGRPWKIFLISADGGTPGELLAENRGQIDANWSDGSRIMFGYVFNADALDIKVLDLKTRKLSTLPGSEGLFSPRWSPDGRYVAAMSPASRL